MRNHDGLRVVLAADIHGHVERLRDLPDADLLVVAGDISHFGQSADVVEVLDKAQERFPLVRVVLGNCDPPKADALIAKRGWDLHFSPARLGPCLFFGLAGSNPTPALTPYEWNDAERLIESEPVVDAVAAADTTAGVVHRILVSHAPPVGSGADVVPGGHHVGSRCALEIARRLNVAYVFCGHIHEARGVYPRDGRTVINPGPLRDGHFATLFFSAEPGRKTEIELE